MKNKYGLPELYLNKIRERDKLCVYCHKAMIRPSKEIPRNDWATIEHLNHLPPWNDPSTVAICCGSCNSSRSDRSLLEWFKTPYCIMKKINIETVSEIVKDYIANHEK